MLVTGSKCDLQKIHLDWYLCAFYSNKEFYNTFLILNIFPKSFSIKYETYENLLNYKKRVFFHCFLLLFSLYSMYSAIFLYSSPPNIIKILYKKFNEDSILNWRKKTPRQMTLTLRFHPVLKLRVMLKVNKGWESHIIKVNSEIPVVCQTWNYSKASSRLDSLFLYDASCFLVWVCFSSLEMCIVVKQMLSSGSPCMSITYLLANEFWHCFPVQLFWKYLCMRWIASYFNS